MCSVDDLLRTLCARLARRSSEPSRTALAVKLCITKLLSVGLHRVAFSCSWRDVVNVVKSNFTVSAKMSCLTNNRNIQRATKDLESQTKKEKPRKYMGIS